MDVPHRPHGQTDPYGLAVRGLHLQFLALRLLPGEKALEYLLRLLLARRGIGVELKNGLPDELIAGVSKHLSQMLVAHADETVGTDGAIGEWCVLVQLTIPFLALRQRLLSTFPIAHIPGERDHQLPLSLLHEPDADLDREGRAVFATMGSPYRYRLAGGDPLEMRGNALRCRFDIDIRYAHPHQLVPCEAETLNGTLVHIDEAAVLVDEEKRVRRLLH